MKRIFKVLANGWRIKLGMFYLRWFNGEHQIKGFRLMINPTTNFWIKLLGFNQKMFGV